MSVFGDVAITPAPGPKTFLQHASFIRQSIASDTPAPTDRPARDPRTHTHTAHRRIYSDDPTPSCTHSHSLNITALPSRTSHLSACARAHSRFPNVAAYPSPTAFSLILTRTLAPARAAVGHLDSGAPASPSAISLPRVHPGSACKHEPVAGPTRATRHLFLSLPLHRRRGAYQT